MSKGTHYVVEMLQYWDRTNGNSYWACRLTRCRDNKTIRFNVDTTNVLSALRRVHRGEHYPNVLEFTTPMSYSEYRTLLKEWPCFSCNPDTLAKQIREAFRNAN